jgi:hypothetical protein
MKCPECRGQALKDVAMKCRLRYSRADPCHFVPIAKKPWGKRTGHIVLTFDFVPISLNHPLILHYPWLIH